MVKNDSTKAFEQGEYDLVFGKADLTITPPGGKPADALVYNVSTTAGDSFILS